MFETPCELDAVPRTDQQRVPALDRQDKRCIGHIPRRRVGNHGVGMKLGAKAAVHVVPDGCSYQAGCRYKVGSAGFHHPDRDEQQSWLHAEQGHPVVALRDPRVVMEQCRRRDGPVREEGDVDPGRAVVRVDRILQKAASGSGSTCNASFGVSQPRP